MRHSQLSIRLAERDAVLKLAGRVQNVNFA